MKRVLVFGASGYSGLELLRWLALHPAVEVSGASASAWAGERVSRRVAGWQGELRFEPHEALLERAPQAGDFAFLATPAKTSLELAPKLLGHGLRVIDLSGAFRLPASADYPEWYGFEHPAPVLLAEADYGLRELFAFDGRAALIANPGCYATAAILAVAPLVRAGLLVPGAPIIMDGKSGTTGAGRNAEESLLYSEVAESLRPYRLAHHQHTPEIEGALTRFAAAAQPVQVSFTAHLAPMRRGLLVSAYAPARAGVGQPEIDAAYAAVYGRQPFVRVLGTEAGERERLPEPGPVAGTNLCDVSARLDPRTRTVLAFGALDNLVKGAAGQAIQNLNALLGLPPGTGLLPTLHPITGGGT